MIPLKLEEKGTQQISLVSISSFLLILRNQLTCAGVGMGVPLVTSYVLLKSTSAGSDSDKNELLSFMFLLKFYPTSRFLAELHVIDTILSPIDIHVLNNTRFLIGIPVLNNTRFLNIRFHSAIRALNNTHILNDIDIFNNISLYIFPLYI